MKWPSSHTCSFDHYGPATGTTDQIVGQWPIGDDVLLGDGWADILRAPVAQTRVRDVRYCGSCTGAHAPADYALARTRTPTSWPGSVPATAPSSPLECLRLTIPGSSQTTRLIHFAFSIVTAATDRRQGYICHFRTRTVLFAARSM